LLTVAILFTLLLSGFFFGFKAKDDFSEWEMKALKGVADVD